MRIYGYSKKKSFYKKLGKRLIALALVIIGAVIISEIRVRPIIIKNSETQSKITATNMINDAVFNQLDSKLYDYSTLVTLTTDNSGNVTSIESNTANINRFKTMVSQQINDSLQQITYQDFGISLGTISAIPFLYGQGPKIPIRLEPHGTVETNLVSKFSSSGINQTLHQILLEVSVDITAIVPAYTTNVTVKTSFILAETVVVGKIPDSYTHIITDNSDLINKISDYGNTTAD